MVIAIAVGAVAVIVALVLTGVHHAPRTWPTIGHLASPSSAPIGYFRW